MNPYAVARISFEDYERMHTQKRAPAVARKLEYAWAFDNEKVRQVVAAHISAMAQAFAVPTNLKRLQRLDSLVLRKMEKGPCEEWRKLAGHALQHGGLAAYFAALIYRSIRLGQDSVEVARSLSTSPWTVRVALWRLNKTAQRLEAGTFRVSQGRPPRLGRKRKNDGQSTWDIRKAVELREAGFKHSEIAAKFGVSQPAVSARLARHGYHFPRVSRARQKTRKFDYVEARRMREAGKTFREIGEAFGVHLTAIVFGLKRGLT